MSGNPTKETFSRWLKRRSQSGNWFVCFEEYWRIMSIEASALIQLIINLGKLNEDSDEWILCPAEYIERRTHGRLKRDSQQRLLNELKGLGVIEWKKMGLPGQRHIRVDLASIERLIDDSQLTGFPVNQTAGNPVEPVNGKSRYPHTEGLKDTLIKTPTSSPNGEEAGGAAGRKAGPAVSPFAKPLGEKSHRQPKLRASMSKEPPQECLVWWDRLHTILRSKRPVVPITSASRTTHAEHLRLLFNSLAEDGERINRLLKWYANAIHTLTRPVITSGKQFKEHFTWLEDHMNKKKRQIDINTIDSDEVT